MVSVKYGLSISNKEGRLLLRVTAGQEPLQYVVKTAFWPCKKPRFLRAVERKWQLDEIKRIEGGAEMIITLEREQIPALVEDMAEILADNCEDLEL